MYRCYLAAVFCILSNSGHSQTSIDSLANLNLKTISIAGNYTTNAFNTNTTNKSKLEIGRPIADANFSDEQLLEFFKKYGPYGDGHIHPTYKHYFQPRTATEMEKILSAAIYENGYLTGFKQEIASKFKDKNWEPYKTSLAAIRNGKVATIGKYEQSGYPEIKYVPGSIFINSYSPYEKQFALKGMKRIISSLVVSGMGLKRLKTYSKDEHTPYHDFLAEYLFNWMQREIDTVKTWSPDFLYRQDGKTYYKNPIYINQIKMVRDSTQLDSIIKVNKNAFDNWKSLTDTPHIITPLVMSVEGAQVLYGPLSGAAENILNPLNIRKHKTKFFRGVDSIKLIRQEILDNIDSIKNLPHRLFCIILGHFAQNHVVGFAKTLDRDPDNVQHRAISTVTRSSPLRNDMIRKTYDGFNPGCERTLNSCGQDSTGFDVVRSFLSTTNTRYKKPTYIDVKHMDIKARIQYYYFRRQYERDSMVHIPIIASHFAVSGEKQALAVATGLRPNFDRYDETEDQKNFYEKQIIKKNDSTYWIKFMQGTNYKKLNRKYQVLNSFERAMYTPMNFLDKSIFDNKLYDPFKGFILDENKLGWYYPWSINLFDEEIIEITKSDGFIGVMLDPRQLGAYMPKSKNIMEKFDSAYSAVADTLQNETLAVYGLTKNDVLKIDYFKTEPLIRNIFYIIQIIKNQKEAEKFYKKGHTLAEIQDKFPDFIKDTLFCTKDPWETIGIGGDFDGFIDPLDYCPTASYIPLLHKRMILYSYIFAQIHKDEFHEPDTKLPLITTLDDSDTKMQQFFFSNLQGFIIKYF